jgi:hypothetical protein
MPRCTWNMVPGGVMGMMAHAHLFPTISLYLGSHVRMLWTHADEDDEKHHPPGPTKLRSVSGEVRDSS